MLLGRCKNAFADRWLRKIHFVCTLQPMDSMHDGASGNHHAAACLLGSFSKSVRVHCGLGMAMAAGFKYSADGLLQEPILGMRTCALQLQ